MGLVLILALAFAMVRELALEVGRVLVLGLAAELVPARVL